MAHRTNMYDNECNGRVVSGTYHALDQTYDTHLLYMSFYDINTRHRA